MANPITAGSEVDSFCTKCKLDLNHRIIAMVGSTVKRVECLTCGGHHNYRRPKTVREHPQVAASAGRRPPSAAARGATGAARKAPARAADPRRTWEAAITGKAPEAFTPYSTSAQLAVGQLVRHKTFGDGVVSGTNEGKAELIFEAGTKTLVYGR